MQKNDTREGREQRGTKTKGGTGTIPFLVGAGLSAVAATVLFMLGFVSAGGLFTVAVPVCLALSVSNHRILSATAFSLWMVAFISAAMFFPAMFLNWGPVDLRNYVIPFIMFIMFCMGTTLSLGDFKRVFLMPQAVVIGIGLQYLIMPFVGKGVAMLFTSNAEIAAGIVITGSSPGGVASNVITYLANGNVALSVTMTAFSTLFAPIMTPTMTKLLAGAYVPVAFWQMMVSIVKMVIIPISSGLLVHSFLEHMGKVNPVYSGIYKVIMAVLPKLSMFVIAFACAIMAANARDQMLVGTIVFGVLISVVVHNILGLLLGYWGARLFHLGERECRTISIEVGLQNSGMAAGLAMSVFKSELAAIPGVIYSSWHNITGALLASWWRNKPVDR